MQINFIYINYIYEIHNFRINYKNILIIQIYFVQKEKESFVSEAEKVVEDNNRSYLKSQDHIMT